MATMSLYLLASTLAVAAAIPIYHNTAIQARHLDAAAPTVHDTENANTFASVIGPVVANDFPDPAIIVADGVSYAFATTNGAAGSALIHVRVAKSTDNSTWTQIDGLDALPQSGAWATGAAVWSPDVNMMDDGTFVLYYADSVKTSPAHHCIGAATSNNILGPYTPEDQPLACPDPNTTGGAIDPDGFQDIDGKRYVTYKVDGNSNGHGGVCGNSVAPIVPTPLMLQEVDTDGITLIGAPVQLLDRSDADGPLIEAPSLHRSVEGIYFLFFSSNCYSTTLYDTSYATSTSINGPYTKSNAPLLVTGNGPNLVGPGGMDIAKDSGMIVFHSSLSGADDKRRKEKRDTLVRGMYTAEATFSGTTVNLAHKSP